MNIPLERFNVWRNGDAPAFWFLGTLVYVRASAAATNGSFTLIEQLAPPGFAPPLHVHHLEDELFFVLAGSVVFRCGDREFSVTEGGSIFLPKGVPHSFRVGAIAARLLQFTSPGGFDQFVEEVSIPAPEKVLPPAGPPPPGILETVAALGPKYHFTILASSL